MRGPVGLRERLDLLRRASGAIPDAAWLRRQFTLDSELAHDASHSLRLLRRSPGFSLAVTLVVALALGSSIALFAVVDVLVLRPLPHPEPEQLMTLWQTNPREHLEKDAMAYARAQRTVVMLDFEALAEKRTRLLFTHSGWGTGPEWDAAYAYFDRAWSSVVLPRLAHRFSRGPIDWKNPPQLEPIAPSLRISLVPSAKSGG